MRRFLPLFAFLLLAALLYAGVRMNSGKDTSAIPSPLIGKPAPEFSLPVLGAPGRTLAKKDFLGKPYLLNVWGSWCPNCRVEHPVISALARSGKLRVVGYNYKDEDADAKRWLGEFGNPYSVNLVDADGRAAFDWGIYGAPESFIVDAQGIVRWKFIGPIDESVVREQIEPLLMQLEGSR